MFDTPLPDAERYMRVHQRKRRWYRVVTCLAAVVVFCTTYALILPAITMTGVLTCDIPEHVHGEECYELTSLLTCDLPEHSHSPDCFDEEGNLLCELEEHTHEEGCYTGERDLICETEVHTHTEDCYASEAAVYCGVAEHVHTQECFDEAGDDICGLEEHAHTESCYQSGAALPPEPEEPGPEASPPETLPAPDGEMPGDPDTLESVSTEIPLETSDVSAALLASASEPPAALSVEEQTRVEEVTALIDALPTAEEIAEQLGALEENEDWEGFAAYYETVSEQCRTASEQYALLSEEAQAAVVKAEKLTELEWLWSAEVLDAIEFTDPTPVQSASTSDFIDLDLYDYNGYINKKYKDDPKYPGFQWNGGAYMYKNTFDRHTVDYIDFGNSNITDMGYGGSGTQITNGKSENAVIVGVLYTKDGAKNTGAINWLWWDKTDASITNRPVGMSTMSSSALSHTLVDGYPALSDGTSLSYLFKDDNYSVFKQNTQSIDGLFQKNETTGAYYFNSRWNHAQYNDEDDTFTLYDQIITPNFIVYPFGNFLPFNTITDSTRATQVGKITSVSGYIDQLVSDMSGSLSGSPTKTQLTAMLKKYKESINAAGITTAREAISDYLIGSGATSSDSLISDDLLDKMYNIDWDEETNFFFGMEMSMEFFQPKGGMTGNDTDKDGQPDYPMEFYFTGDDDVWVYIDDVLFLDLTGIHRHVGGKIDFVNGIVEYYTLDTAGTGDVSSSTPYKTFTFRELLEAAGKSTDGLNEKGAFQDYTTHSFQFYYMERGSGSSVCRMNFNFPLLKKNSISVTKELSTESAPLLGDPDFKFQVLSADGSGNKTDKPFIGAGVVYQLYDEDGTELDGEYTTDENGVFTLKAGQTAVFSDISEDSGRYFVRELLDESVYEQYDKIRVNGSSVTVSNDVTVGSDRFTGMDSPVKDMSDGSTRFAFNNHVDADKLGSLSIGKRLTEYPKAKNALKFELEVTLDGVLLPVGTEYTVGDETRTVEQAGIIRLAPDETATISKILAGSRFTVQELEASAEGYVVSYAVDGGAPVSDRASGTIGVRSTVQIVVTNAEKGVSAQIPIKKTLEHPDGGAHEYLFHLEQVTDATGTSAAEPGFTEQLSIEVTENAEGCFEIGYPLNALETLPRSFYYKIWEEDAGGSAICDRSVYVVEVTIQETEDGVTAEVTKYWKDGVELTEGGITFVNALGIYELPQTGGPGTIWHIAGGFALLLSAAALWLWKKHRGKGACPF